MLCSCVHFLFFHSTRNKISQNATWSGSGDPKYSLELQSLDALSLIDYTFYDISQNAHWSWLCSLKHVLELQLRSHREISRRIGLMVESISE